MFLVTSVALRHNHTTSELKALKLKPVAIFHPPASQDIDIY